MDNEWDEQEREWALALSRLLYEQGGEAEQRLKDKCKWENMTRMGVILEWGDPRKWTTK